MQAEVRAAFPDLAQRRAFLRSVLDGPAAEAALAGDGERAEALLREALAAGLTSAGSVRLVAGVGPADLLTLRAARALAEADVLVVDPGADPGVVTLARRDARRLAAEDADGTALKGMLGEGQQLVWITGPGGTEAAQLRLGAEGIGAAAL
jgi:precorrin-2 dehydrogenase/sirohydrochlorin ferrochelatase